MNKEEKDLSGMSLDELDALEEEMSKADAAGDDTPKEDSVPTEKHGEAEKIVPEGGKVEPEKGDDSRKDDDRNIDQENVEDDGADGVEDKAEEVEKHVSPPQKWIANRHKARQVKLDQELSDKNTELQSKIDVLQQQVDFLKAKGVDVPESPLDILSEERIKEVREEHGDAVADMFQAVKAAVSVGRRGQQDAASPEGDIGGQEEPMDERVQALISDDHISYWLAKKPELYDLAVESDKELSLDPKFMAKSYEDQAKAIVDKVKETVLAERKLVTTRKPDKKGSDEPPRTMSGTSGTAPTQTEKTASQSIKELAESDRMDEALAAYEKMPDGPEKEKIEEWLEL